MIMKNRNGRGGKIMDKPLFLLVISISLIGIGQLIEINTFEKRITKLESQQISKYELNSKDIEKLQQLSINL